MCQHKKLWIENTNINHNTRKLKDN
jgi:hypothetical protein